jgi:hypothetical protein
MVVHMCHPMAGQHVSIERTKHSRIPNFYGIAEVFRQLPKKCIEFADKVALQQAMALKFEQEWSGMWAEVRFSIGCQHQILEQVGIEESRIGLPRLHAIARLFREGWDRDFLPDLEAHLEILRDLVEIVFELIGGRWPVEGGIIADGPEEWFAVVEILTVLT